MMTKEVSVVVPINIALVKYWGKRDADLILPLNDSLSLTVDGLYAKTHVKIIETDSKKNEYGDSVTINCSEICLADYPRFSKCFDEIRRILKPQHSSAESFRFVVDSETNFPVGAGLASSAAGFAAIAYALGNIFEWKIEDICRTARLGSGSACRSVYPGLVRWNAGTDDKGADCTCEVVATANYWPSLTAVVVVVSTQTKAYGSTDGMCRSVETSSLLRYRVQVSVNEHLKSIESAYHDRNFPKFAEFVMKESNQLHAVCLDTYPPLLYLSESSKKLIHFVHAYNKASKVVKLAYTFDAGANCCLFLERENLNNVLSSLCHYFPNTKEEKFIRGCPELNRHPIDSCLIDGLTPTPNAVEFVIVSTVGAGPRVLP